MSKITTAYDALLLVLQTQLPTHFRLTNAYDTANNDVKRLNKGYAIALRGALDTNRQVSCVYSLRRDISVILTRRFYAKEHDLDAKEDGAIALLEDAHTLIREFTRNPTLDATDTVMNFRYVSDNGIEQVFTNKECYLRLELNCTLEYLEDVNV